MVIKATHHLELLTLKMTIFGFLFVCIWISFLLPCFFEHYCLDNQQPIFKISLILHSSLELCVSGTIGYILEKKPALMFRTCKEIRGCARMNEFFPLNKDCAFEVYNYFPFSLFSRKTDARCQNVS